jgi:hypothetical protein
MQHYSYRCNNLVQQELTAAEILVLSARLYLGVVAEVSRKS